MKNFKQWMKDKLFDLLTRLSPTEQPTPDELRAWALEEAQKLQAPHIWIDPTIRSYPQPQKIVNPRGSYFKARHLEFMPEPVRTNTEPIDRTKDFPDWLNSLSVEHMMPAEIERVPTIRDLTPDKDVTEKVPAIMKMLHQEREQRRHAS